MKEKSVKNFKLLTKIYTEIKNQHILLKNILKIALIKLKQKGISYNSIKSINWPTINKTNSIESSIGIMSSKNNDYELISEIERSLLEIATARNVFDNVDESRLIDIAIYSEYIAIKRFDYLISVAKEKCISVSSEYIASKFLEFTEPKDYHFL